MKSCFIYTSICIHICVYVHIKTRVNWVFLTTDQLYPKINAIFSRIAIFRIMFSTGSHSLWNMISLCTSSWPHAVFLASRNILFFYYLWQGIMDVRLASNLLRSLAEGDLQLQIPSVFTSWVRRSQTCGTLTSLWFVWCWDQAPGLLHTRRAPCQLNCIPRLPSKCFSLAQFHIQLWDPHFPAWLLLPAFVDVKQRPKVLCWLLFYALYIRAWLLLEDVWIQEPAFLLSDAILTRVVLTLK